MRNGPLLTAVSLDITAWPKVVVLCCYEGVQPEPCRAQLWMDEKKVRLDPQYYPQQWVLLTDSADEVAAPM